MGASLASRRTRPWGETPYVYLDARYEKVRLDGQVCDAAVLIAMGVLPCLPRG
jgi:transposase-like protein